MLSFIIPVLNEAQRIDACLNALASLRAHDIEIIVVDGGSTDDTLARASAHGVAAIVAPRGRAAQMNAGAALARGDALVFLHADTLLPDNAFAAIEQALATGHRWGRFDVHFDDAHPLLAVVAGMMNARSRLTGIATGDQAMFVTRDTFERVGGFPALALMEDVALSKRLKREGAPAALRARVTTSARRWRARGIVRTIVMMWWLRLLFFCGVSDRTLHRLYHGRA